MTSKHREKQLQNFLFKIGQQAQKVERAIDGTQIREQQTIEVLQAIELVQSQLRPAREPESLTLYETGRARRSFEAEHRRLWRHALHLYLDGFLEGLSLPIQEILRRSIADGGKEKFLAALELLVSSITLPILEKHKDASEDLYLFVCGVMGSCEDDRANTVIAKTGKTPPEDNCAFYSMFGLLTEAKKAAENGDLPKAYSFLLDTNHLIGMHEAARYTMQRLDAVSAKRQASKNSAKSRKRRQDGIQKEANELFFSLRRTAEGERKPWKSAREATDIIWKVLTKEETKDAGIGYETLQKLCRMWHKQDLEGPEPRLNVILKSTDGRSFTIPLS